MQEAPPFGGEMAATARAGHLRGGFGSVLGLCLLTSRYLRRSLAPAGEARGADQDYHHHHHHQTDALQFMTSRDLLMIKQTWAKSNPQMSYYDVSVSFPSNQTPFSHHFATVFSMIDVVLLTARANHEHVHS